MHIDNQLQIYFILKKYLITICSKDHVQLLRTLWLHFLYHNEWNVSKIRFLTIFIIFEQKSIYMIFISIIRIFWLLILNIITFSENIKHFSTLYGAELKVCLWSFLFTANLLKPEEDLANFWSQKDYKQNLIVYIGITCYLWN
jgi:hypothetical protein